MTIADEVLRLTRELIQLDTSNAVSAGMPGNETLVAEHLASYLSAAGIECTLVAREPHRANLVARIPGIGSGPSLAFVGHSDVVPADARDWTHPPFAAVVDDDGWLYGRGAIDMKNEVAARAVAMAWLARSSFRPQGDLWFLAVADEEDGMADVGMRWLLEERPDIRPDFAINEGGGDLLPLTDGRVMMSVGVGEKGTYPVRVVALGEAGHGSTPTVGDNAVPKLGEILRRIGRGEPTPSASPMLEASLDVLVGPSDAPILSRLAAAGQLHESLTDLLPALVGTTMAPTMIGGSSKRNVMPARAWVELDCRILPGTTAADVEAAVRARLGDGLSYELEWPEPLISGSSSAVDTPLMSGIAAALDDIGIAAALLPLLGTGFTDSVYLRAAGVGTAYGFTPFQATPVEVVTAGFHNADERIHVDDLTLSAAFHVELARRVVGGGLPTERP